ncbi:hypothetical protein FFV09_12305 [Saccharibacillus brassicae]|uniref:Uncharacterized protein n=1 Tax=Saccharibacillus brassicae TaxID=2583377 RepID=A0A4Y6UV12_SACBS|nr:hypothetical protein FFV09_12305 [Saccharibacillus brassicae]
MPASISTPNSGSASASASGSAPNSGSASASISRRSSTDAYKSPQPPIPRPAGFSHAIEIRSRRLSSPAPGIKIRTARGTF